MTSADDKNILHQSAHKNSLPILSPYSPQQLIKTRYAKYLKYPQMNNGPGEFKIIAKVAWTSTRAGEIPKHRPISKCGWPSATKACLLGNSFRKHEKNDMRGSQLSQHSVNGKKERVSPNEIKLTAC